MLIPPGPATIGQDRPSRVLERAIQAASVRQRVIANNLANVNTPGFKRSRVEFEQHMAQALGNNAEPSDTKATVVQEIDTSGRPDGNNVDLELEMTQMAENQIWQQALVRQISDHFGRMHQVISDGRR